MPSRLVSRYYLNELEVQNTHMLFLNFNPPVFDSIHRGHKDISKNIAKTSKARSIVVLLVCYCENECTTWIAFVYPAISHQLRTFLNGYIEVIRGCLLNINIMHALSLLKAVLGKLINTEYAIGRDLIKQWPCSLAHIYVIRRSIGVIYQWLLMNRTTRQKYHRSREWLLTKCNLGRLVPTK